MTALTAARVAVIVLAVAAFCLARLDQAIRIWQILADARKGHTTRDARPCHNRRMTDDSSHLIDINAKPTYQERLHLRSGASVRVTVVGREIFTEIRDDADQLVAGRMTAAEAREMASMLDSADCQARSH